MRAATGFRCWVRQTKACARCGRTHPDPHHLKAIGLGGTSDPEEKDRDNVIPLCRACHAWIHNRGARTALQELAFDPVELARSITIQWERLAPSIRESWEAYAAREDLAW